MHHRVLISATGIWAGYDPKVMVLQGVNVDVYAGMSTMILGRSGSGKTTLLRAIGGIIKTNRGQISYPNGNVRIAYIPQTLGLVRGMSVIDNVLTGCLRDTSVIASLFKHFSSESLDKARQLLKAVGLDDKAHVPVARLSGGQRQRVAIARALIQEPDIILADEFVSQLDVWTMREIFNLVKPLSSKKVAMFITTHDADLAKEYAHRVLVMSKGKIIFESQINDVSTAQMVGLLQ